MKPCICVLLIGAVISLNIVPLSADESSIHGTGLFVGEISDEELIRYATEAQNYSYSPYSHFKVGAALLTMNGTVYTGANIENADYGLTIGAEQVAVVKAVSEGEQTFTAIAITGSGDDYVYPTGPDRQVLSEFGNDIRVIISNGTTITSTTVRDLLPEAFGPENIVP